MLGAIAAVAPPLRTVGAIEYAGGELRIRGLASTPDEARVLSEGLRGRGYAADLRDDTLVITTQEAL